MTAITEEYQASVPLSTHITNLYTSAPKIEAINNTVNYEYANIYDTDTDVNTIGGLMVDDGNNTRYYGANPSNYIYFNCDDYTNQSSSTCELWRIIGVFDGKVKIIRNESIGDYSWDNKDTTTGAESAYGKNDWTTARLMKLLNPGDYYTVDPNDNGNGQSLYWKGESGTCFSGSNNATKACDFTKKGLKNNTTRNKIAEVVWNLGGWYDNQIYSKQIYYFERGTERYDSNRPITWLGKIGLMYPSDYGYATDFNYCTTNLYKYYDYEAYYETGENPSTVCRENDWLYNGNGEFQWLLTPSSDSTYYAWIVESLGGVFGDNSVFNEYGGIRPTLFLTPEQVITMGDGSSGSPYKLGV